MTKQRFLQGAIGKLLVALSVFLVVGTAAYKVFLPKTEPDAKAPDTVVVAKKAPSDCKTAEVCRLYDFMKFIEWPATYYTESFPLCVLGHNAFGQGIYTLNGAPLKGTSIRVLTEVGDNQVEYCRVIFIGSDEGAQIDAVLEKIKGEPVLTISNMPSFISKGGMIAFTIGATGETQFEISREHIEQARLRVSSKLLTLGKE